MRRLPHLLPAIACLVLVLAGPARANLVWNWSAGGGAHTGQIVTNGTSFAAGAYTVLDVSFQSSTFMPLGSVSGGPYSMPIAAFETTPPYTIHWDGSAVTSIDAAANTGVDGLVIGDDATNMYALFGTDSFGSHVPGDWEFQNADFTMQRGGDLVLTPVPLPAPEIAVKNAQSQDLPNGGSQDFGPVTVGAAASLVFTIQNVGAADLTGLAVTSDTPEFAVTVQPAASVAASGSTTFTVEFAPAAGGARSGALHIASNDADENPFNIGVTGTGRVDCVVSAWSDWSPCCNATQSRTRTVVTPAQGGGVACPDLIESRPCGNPRPHVTIRWPKAGQAYRVDRTLAFDATFTDTTGVTHTGTWTVNGSPQPTSVVEPTSGNPGAASASRTFNAVGSYVVGLVLGNSCGGADTTSVTISVTVPDTFPRAPVLDGFNRANGPIGGNWTDQTSSFSIGSQQLVHNGGQTYIEWAGGTFGPNQEVYVTLSAIDPISPEHNLMLKTQGATWSTGHIEVSYDAGLSKVSVNTYTPNPPGNWVTRGSITGVTFAPGDQFGARARSDATVTVYKNGATLGTVTVNGWPYYALGGRIGISAVNALNSRFDDFGGGDVTSPLLPVPTPAEPAARVSLSGALPNPTSGAATLMLTLPREAEVSFRVLDIEGRTVWQAPTERRAAGRVTLVWNGRTTRGPATPGVYLASVRAGDKSFFRRIAVVH